MMLVKRIVIRSTCAFLLLSGCNQQKADPNVIETKLADGRVLHYTRQQLAEANSWGITQAAYESELAVGHTHGAIIQDSMEYYRVRLRGMGVQVPQGAITPPPEMRVTN